MEIEAATETTNTDPGETLATEITGLIAEAFAEAARIDEANECDTTTTLIECLATEIGARPGLVAEIISQAQAQLGAEWVSQVIVDDAYETYTILEAL